MVCPSCHSENPAGAKFCSECGTALVAVCPSCGADHRPGQRFCAECGTALAAGAPAESPSRATEPAQATAEMRMVSVLFVDLVGYTSLSETRDAEDVREVLGRYFETARTIIGRYGGVVEKFIGDAVMAVWGTPTAREDDAERAVRAGLDLVDAVSAFGAEVGAPELRARAGVVTGHAASVSTPEEGLVVGDSVNTASRVQSTAEPDTVYVDEVTRQASSAAIAYEDAGEHTVKGKAEPLQLWRAARVVAGAGGTLRDEGLEAPFTGRDQELRLLKELYHAGVDRRAAGLVAVSGPAGVGKSRLRQEFINYTSGIAETVFWHSGRCLSYGDGVAYWALAEMVRQRLGLAEEAPAGEVADKLAAGLGRWVPDPGEREFIGPRLGALLRTSDEGINREELFAGWRLFFERLADLDTVVLCFEDVQWADGGLLDFIENLLEWSTRHPIFVLTFARPDLAERRAAWPPARPGVTPLYLEPLGDDDVGELLDGVVAGLPAGVRAQIVGQAEGIALYAMETVRALADRGTLVATEDGLVVAGDVGELQIPPTLSSLLTARLDGLEPEERTLVMDLAVMGGSFPRATVSAMSSLSDERIDALLAALVRKQILRVTADPLSPDRGQYAFTQALLRTVAYDLLSKRERKPRHLAVARHLRQAFPNDGEELAEVIAAHYLEAYHAAGDDPDAGELRAEALSALRRAGRRAQTVGAPDAAERSYRAALELATDEREHAELTEAAGRMADAAGRYDDAIELFEAAAAAHLAAGREREAARLSRHIGKSLRVLGRVSESIERLQSALTVLDPDLMDADVAAMNAELGTSLVFAGRHEEAEPVLARAVRAAEALELRDVLCNGLISSAILCFWTGRFEQGRVLLQGAADIADRFGLIYEATRARINLGDLLTSRDLPESQQHLREAMAAARRAGYRGLQCVTACNLMTALLLTGGWDEAAGLSDELLTQGFADSGDAEAAEAPMAQLCTLRGDVAGAREHLSRMHVWADNEDVELRMSFAMVSGFIQLAEGHAEEALEVFTATAHEGLRTVMAFNDVVRQTWPAAADTALALGRLDDAKALVELMDAQPRGSVPPFVRTQQVRIGALVAAADGRHEGVEADLSTAIEGFRSLGYPYWVARALTDLAAWLVQRDRAADAAAPLDEAIAVLDGLGAAPALARARALLSAVPGAAPGAAKPYSTVA